MDPATEQEEAVTQLTQALSARPACQLLLFLLQDASRLGLLHPPMLGGAQAEMIVQSMAELAMSLWALQRVLPRPLQVAEAERQGQGVTRAEPVLSQPEQLEWCADRRPCPFQCPAS